MEKLSSTLKQLLTNANISEAELARRTGIAQPMVNRLATGKNKNPKLETLKPIAKYFSITFSQLLGEEELPKNIQNSDQFNSDSSQVFQLPVIEFDRLDVTNLNSERIIATNVKVSSNAFALLLNNNDFAPRFPKNTVLTIEPNSQFSSNDFVLINDLKNNTIKLVQIKTTDDGTQLLTSLNNTQDKPYPFDQSTHQIIGVLMQTSYDYK